MEEARPQTPVCRPPGTGPADTPTDTQLLRRFAASRDQEAFARLVERHGPLVLGVCRRVLGTVQDAEDAFQATFLVLARRAGSIRDPALLGNWLYGVASRIARKARAAVRKRQMHEKPSPLLPSLVAPAVAADPDLGPVLDEELSRLPEKYRAAVVLCYLQGKTNEEAARLLRWPTGTVKGRLARARDLLRDRLVRRGLQASALLLATCLAEAQARAASVPPGLAEAATRAGVSFAGGSGVAGGASPAAVRLAEAALQSLRGARRVAVSLVLLLAILTTLFGTATAGAALLGRHVFGPSGGCGGGTGSHTTDAAR
jgi:RNA polymerase sigma-70 factor (ECF subfamily)